MVVAKKSTTSTKAAVLEEDSEVEQSIKQLINDGITLVVEATGIDVQKSRYKAMRAIAFQAFSNAISDGTFDDLVQTAIANADLLPSGWELERSEPVEKPAKATKVAAPKAPRATKAAAAKAVVAEEAPAKPARRRPTR